MYRALGVYCISLMVLLCGCLEDGKLKIDLNMEPADVNDGIEISTPADEGFDEIALRDAYGAFFSEECFITGISLLIVRNGKLIAEGYSRSMEDMDVKRNIQSATKSFTAEMIINSIVE